MSEKIWFLKRCDLFEHLTPVECQHLERHAIMRSFKRTEVIYFPMEPGQSVLVLLNGRVKIKALSPDGKETIFAFIGAGEIFGELALLDTEPRQEFAEAVEDSKVLVIPREDLLWLMGRRPDVSLRITKLVGLRRRCIENRLRNILFRPVRQRVVHLLLELLETHGQRRGQSWEICLRLSHQELANLIGATREAVTLALGRLQLEKLIRVRRRRVTVLDRARLAREATGLDLPNSPRVAPVLRPNDR